ncbi:MAG: tail fiber domain-containing protein [Chitinophagaceae bacterium]|nr:tail fiber domain-containing protein [Chitinophagaceae bacterium]
MKKQPFVCALMSLLMLVQQPQVLLAQGKIGINTNTPLAMLHVKDSSVLFSGDTTLNAGKPPISGAGARMMWYADKGAFRAGSVDGTQWNQENTGFLSIALGRNTIASGDRSTALGVGNTASGVQSIAMGFTSNASGPNAIVMGVAAAATGTGSIAFGNNTVARGENAFVVGERSFALGDVSIAMGNQTVASGSESIAMGRFSDALGVASLAMGNGTSATGNFSTSMGFSTNAKAYASLAIGQLNDSIANSNATSHVTTDPAFIIGNGTSNIARRNAFIVAKNGETGINVANGMPQAMLHIKARVISDNRHIRLEDDNTSATANIFYTSDLVFKNNLAGGDFIFRNDANAIIFSLFSSGNVTMAGTLTQNSDARLKKDIQPLQSSLQKLLQLGGYHYHWSEAFRDQHLQTGLLAQQVEQQMPELVATSKDGVKSVNYSGMIPYTIEAIKELKKENDELKTELMQLKQLIQKVVSESK